MKPKLGYLDGLRGVASVVVVLHHFACAFLPGVIFGGDLSPLEKGLRYTPAYLLVAGQFAVAIFFVLSGFVLSYKFFWTGDTGVVTSGAMRRYFRLMPTVLVAVLLAYVVMAGGWMRNLAAAPLTHSPWLVASWSGAPNLGDALKLGVWGALVTPDSAQIVKYDNVLWTMHWEFLGSLLVFAVLALFGSVRRRWLVYIALGLALAQTYLLGFVLGLAICDWLATARRRGRPLGSSWLGAMAVAQGLSLGALCLLRPFLLAVAAALTLAGVLLLPRLQRGLASRPLRWLGRISFAMYLVHLLVLGTVGCWVYAHTAARLGGLGAAGISLLASLPLIVGLAMGLARWVDEPAIRFSSRLVHWLQRPGLPWQAPAAASTPNPAFLYGLRASETGGV